MSWVIICLRVPRSGHQQENQQTAEVSWEQAAGSGSSDQLAKGIQERWCKKLSKGKSEGGAWVTVKMRPGTALVVQRLRLHAPSVAGLGSITGQGTRPPVLQLSSRAATKDLTTHNENWGSQSSRLTLCRAYIYIHIYIYIYIFFLSRTSEVVERLRTYLTVQGTQIWPLVQEDCSTCRGATKAVCHSCWAQALEPVLHKERSHHNEKSKHWN